MSLLYYLHFNFLPITEILMKHYTHSILKENSLFIQLCDHLYNKARIYSRAQFTRYRGCSPRYLFEAFLFPLVSFRAICVPTGSVEWIAEFLSRRILIIESDLFLEKDISRQLAAGKYLQIKTKWGEKSF